MKIIIYSEIKISYCGLHDKCVVPIKVSFHKMVQMITQGIERGEGWVCFILLEDIYIIYKYHSKSFKPYN